MLDSCSCPGTLGVSHPMWISSCTPSSPWRLTPSPSRRYGPLSPYSRPCPPCFACHSSSAEGCGTRFVLGWRRSLQHPATPPRIEHDAPDLLVSTVRHHTLGFLLLASVHIHPDLDYKSRRAVLINLTTLATYLRAALELVRGDLLDIPSPSRPPPQLWRPRLPPPAPPLSVPSSRDVHPGHLLQVPTRAPLCAISG